MRPRPIIPSCTSHLLDVDSRSAAAALLEGRIVPGRLGAKQAPEAERLPGNRDLVAGIVDDLEEEPAAATKLADEAVDATVVLLVRLDEGLDADVVVLVRLREQAVDRALRLHV